MSKRRESSKSPEWAEDILERVRSEDGDEDTIVSCAYDVVNIGEEALPLVRQWLTASHYRVRSLAVESLARLRGIDAMDELRPLMTDSHPFVRSALCRAIAHTKAESGVDFVNTCLQDTENREVLSAALKAAGVLASASSREFSDALLSHEAYGIADDAAKVVAKLGQLESLKAVARALRSDATMSERELLDSAAALLNQHGPLAFRAALQELATSELGAFTSLLRGGEVPADLESLRKAVDEVGRQAFDLDVLRRFGTLLSDEAERGRLAPALRASDRVETVTRLLEGPSARSVLLLGPPGVGKTALVHAVASRLRENGSEVVEVRGADLIRGKVYLGQWQEHVLQLVDAARRPKPVVLYAPDINEWVDLGKTSSTEDSVLSALRPYIEREDLVILAESTPESFRAGLGRTPAFSAPFQVVPVRATPDDETLQIAERVLQSETEKLSRKVEGLTLTWEADLPRRALELTGHVYSGQENPGRTISLLRLITYDVARRAELGEIHGELELTEKHLLAILHQQTGIPAELLDDTVPLRLSEVRRFFEERVIGQPEAVDVVVDLLALIKAGLTNPDKPLSVLLFVGPTGVGKTELARALAEYLFGSADRMVRIDMSEFQDPGAMERLTGNPLLNAGGLITEPVREQPFCLVLLDEIEKAYRGVHDLLLQVFDGGRLTDGRGRTTSFRRTVIAMTSNVGSDTPRGGAVGFVEAKERDRLDALAAVENSFRRELVNRIDHIVAFRPLGVDAMEGIARRELQRALSRSGLVRRSVSVDLDPSVLSLILRQGFSPRYGARPLKRAIEQHVLVPIARKLVGVTGRGEEPTVLQVDGRGGATVHVRLVEEPPKPKVKVNVTDPFGDGRSEKFDLPQIRERVRLLIASLRELRRLCEQRDYSGEIAALTLEMGRHGAWANPNDARSRTARLHMLEQLLSSLRAAERRAADLEEQSQSSEIDRKRDTLKRLGERILVEEEHYRLLRFEVGTTHEDDRYDGFLEISLVDGQGPHPGPVALLARMYEAYAKRHSLRCTHLFEEVDDNGLPSSAELYIEGVPAYGLLRNESGIHRFSWAHTGASTYSNVRVHLLPDRPHAAPPLRPSDVLREELPARGPRVLVGSARTSLRLTHAPSLTTVRVMVSDDTSAREALALDLLAARVAAASTAMSPPLEVVRRYRMGTQQEVRDQNTGLRTGRLEHVLAGHLDPFVLPQLEHTLTAELRGGRP